jgi:hypothetical protein
MVGFREDRQRTACQRGSALTLCARLRRMLFVPLDRTGWRAAGEREERAGSNILFLRCLREEPAGSNILYYGVYRRDQTPLYDGSQEGYKKDQRPLYDGKGLVLFCTMEASETKCPCTMEKALLFRSP